jgi:hypothetical protein
LSSSVSARQALAVSEAAYRLTANYPLF